jgi:hypothetical protein
MTFNIKRSLITVAALVALVAAAFGAVQFTTHGSRVVCLPPAFVQAWS